MKKLAEKTELDFFYQKLAEAGWNWNTPQIQNYIKRVESKIQRPITSPANAPSQTLIRLCVFIDLYLKVDEALKDNFYTWQDSDIKITLINTEMVRL
jgi:hypothetical protein